MARTFSDVLAEVTAQSDPQRKTVLDQIAALPTQQAADESALEAKRLQANYSILADARRRGLGYAGIPLGEQAKYAATDYAPALANLKSTYGQRKGTLESALAGIGQNDYSNAYNIFNQDRAFEEQQRQFDLQQRAAAAQQSAFAGLFGGGNQQQPQQQQSPLTLPGITLKNPQLGGSGGYNFSFGNKPISAVGLAQVNGVNPADILYSMATAGDAYAANAYKDIVGNGGKITPDIAQKYYSLFWGTNLLPAQATPSPAVPKVDTNFYPNANKVPGFLGINR